MVTHEMRDAHLSQFQNVELQFGKVTKSAAWPLVNSLIEVDRDKKPSHLFQVQHSWEELLKSEIDPIEKLWGRSEFALEPSPFDILNASLKTDGSVKALHNAEAPLSDSEYLTHREALQAKMQGAIDGGVLRKHVLATRSHAVAGRLLHCECGKVVMGEEVSARHGTIWCAVCGTVAGKRVDEPVPEEASGLLIPYPFSYFEFAVNHHHWLIEVAEQENGTAILKYYFYFEKQWMQVTFREFRENPVFVALKRQVIGSLIALEAKVAVRSNHEDARPPMTPAMMERLKKVFKQEFNFGYSVIDLVQSRRKSGATNEEPSWRVRLHFRRGFWRTRLGKRERVRWCLVGDPSLGFVDKHYRFKV